MTLSRLGVGSRWTHCVSLCALSAGAFSCAARPAQAKAPVVATASRSTPNPAKALSDPVVAPPPDTTTPDVPFPSISHAKLDNGLELRVVTRKTYPIIELRLVLFSGSASDGTQPGVASFTGESLKAGGAGEWSAAQLAERAESLGSSVEIETGRDSTQISMAVTTGDFDVALDLLGAVAQHPRFAVNEFEKLKQRELENVKNEAKSSPGWAASMVMYRELFHSAFQPYPYSRFDAEPADINRLTLASCKHWYQLNVTPENATLVIAGDVEASLAKAAAQRVFSGWKGARPAAPVFDSVLPPLAHTIWVVDRPHSAQSQIYVAGLGPERSSPSWPAVTAANQVLGGGVAGRLFLDIREKRSLAYSTGSSLEELAHGPVPVVLSAGTQTAKTALALQALLDNAQKISSTPPSDAEVSMASRSLSDSFLFHTETVDAIADLTAKLAVLGLPDDYFDSYRHILARLDRGALFQAAHRSFAFKNPVIVIAGDASQISKPLSHFATVVVVDPNHDFESSNQVSMDERQPL